jgi:hypothetical protein
MTTPVDATTAGRAASKPAAVSCAHHEPPASKSTGTRRSQSGTPKPSSTRRRRFHACGPGRSTSNTVSCDASSGRRCANVSSPAPSSTYCVTPRAVSSAISSSMKRARATIDARKNPVPRGSMSGRSRQPSGGAISASPSSSSKTCGGGSICTCSARQSAVRAAVESGASSAMPERS